MEFFSSSGLKTKKKEGVKNNYLLANILAQTLKNHNKQLRFEQTSLLQSSPPFFEKKSNTTSTSVLGLPNLLSLQLYYVI